MVESAIRRDWPDDTRMRIVGTDDNPARNTAAFYSDGKTIYEAAAERLASVGLTVSVQIQSGDARAVLLQAAEAWRADAIMISANSSGGPGLDETATALVTTAKCTVEIVR